MSIHPEVLFVATGLVLVAGRLYKITFSRRKKIAIDLSGGESNISQTQKDWLMEFFPFYANLQIEERTLFDQRLSWFIRTKNFEGMERLTLTESMITLVAAIPIQMTMGMNDFSLPHFDTIRIYPKEYYSPITRQMHNGDVNMRGIISLSWSAFSEGLSKFDSGRNLAIHEFAHAFYFENDIDNTSYDFIDQDALADFESIAAIEMKRMESNSAHFIRGYGSVNMHEFFAVCSEHFFEQAKDFSIYLPKLFNAMCRIYNQDPRYPFKIRS